MDAKREITEGDIVWVMFDDRRFQARVVHIPGETGDMWHVETHHEIFALNPMASKLVGFQKIDAENK